MWSNQILIKIIHDWQLYAVFSYWVNELRARRSRTSDLVVKDEGPDETESQLRIAIDNLISTNVHHFDLHQQQSHTRSARC